jgi:hypothetical protein
MIKKAFKPFVVFFRALPLPPGGGCGSGASGLPAPPLLRCGRVCALTRAPYRPLARGLRPLRAAAIQPQLSGDSSGAKIQQRIERKKFHCPFQQQRSRTKDEGIFFP